ncbi:MAG: cold shock domain-containing protein [Actinomycetota bacterium]|nr:cold shock domain-containing protein [Actinomycetota bacterium]
MTERGTVVDFDQAEGFGWVQCRDGRRLFFHCTAVADSSRSVPVGAQVAFEVVAGHGGSWEAASLVTLG